MWSAIGGAVLKTVADQLLNPNEPKRENCRIQGHINNVPINLTINQSSNANSSGAHKRTSNNQTTKKLGSSNSSYQREGPKKHNNNAGRNPNKEKFVMVNLPKTNGNFQAKIKKPESQPAKINPKVPQKHYSNAQKEANNFEVKIKKTELQFAKMNVGGPNGPQKHHNNAQKNSQKRPNMGNQPKRGKNIDSSSPNNDGSTWMYLGRLKIGTTEIDVKSYLKELFPGYNFIVEPLPLYRDGILPCFKVLVDGDILEKFQEADNWPNGVKITKFHDNFKK